MWSRLADFGADLRVEVVGGLADADEVGQVRVQVAGGVAGRGGRIRGGHVVVAAHGVEDETDWRGRVDRDRGVVGGRAVDDLVDLGQVHPDGEPAAVRFGA